MEVDRPLPENANCSFGETESQIGKHIAELVPNGATIQMGIGDIPNAALAALSNHEDLGVHTEMFSDGVVPLVEKGVITNEYKKVEPGKIVTTFVLGTRKVYDFVHDNPFVAFRDVAWVNDTAVIRKNQKVVAINSAIQIDLTGQVCADSIGTYQYYDCHGRRRDRPGVAGQEAATVRLVTSRRGELLLPAETRRQRLLASGFVADPGVPERALAEALDADRPTPSYPGAFRKLVPAPLALAGGPEDARHPAKPGSAEPTPASGPRTLSGPASTAGTPKDAARSEPARGAASMRDALRKLLEGRGRAERQPDAPTSAVRTHRGRGGRPR